LGTDCFLRELSDCTSVPLETCDGTVSSLWHCHRKSTRWENIGADLARARRPQNWELRAPPGGAADIAFGGQHDRVGESSALRFISGLLHRSIALSPSLSFFYQLQIDQILLSSSDDIFIILLTAFFF